MEALRQTMLALLAAIAAWPAAAQVDRHDLRRRHMQEEQRLAPAPAQPGFAPAEPRDGRGSGGRMSPEERRQLRRDIQDARRDLYPQRPPSDQEFRRF